MEESMTLLKEELRKFSDDCILQGNIHAKLIPKGKCIEKIIYSKFLSNLGNKI